MHKWLILSFYICGCQDIQGIVYVGPQHVYCIHGNNGVEKLTNFEVCMLYRSTDP